MLFCNYSIKQNISSPYCKGCVHMDTKEKVLQFAKRFDHTLLRPNATFEDFHVFCRDCWTHHFRMAAINSAPVSYCRSLLEGSGVRVGAAIGFPLGQIPLEAKVFEAQQAIQQGADDIDYVINITALKAKDYSYIMKEMEQIVSLCRKNGAISKVIFENCYLTAEEIAKMAEIALQIGPDFIKTSTGFGTSGATVQDVRLMKSVVGDAVKIKAAGGIVHLQDCFALIDSGAVCLGSSHSVDILREYKDYLSRQGS